MKLIVIEPTVQELVIKITHKGPARFPRTPLEIRFVLSIDCTHDHRIFLFTQDDFFSLLRLSSTFTFASAARGELPVLVTRMVAFVKRRLASPAFTLNQAWEARLPPPRSFLLSQRPSVR